MIPVAGRTAPPTDVPDDPLTVANQRLVKALDALEKAERLNKALEAEIELRKRLDAVKDELIQSKNAIIGDQRKEIDILRKQTGRKISLVFGLIRVRF